VADDYANQDPFIFVGFITSNKPPNISMKPKLVYLPAKDTSVTLEI
jgi:hypothetical protein